ncbi:MAG: TlpA disulfide reductase family protein [Kiloniellales bacterium]|nr:TlpA disulfide reductase family protein [Kiloniellales bacterium]
MKRLLLIMVLVTLSLAPSARAESDGIVLDQARRAALAELPPLVRKQLLEEHLKDRVVVVGFFASWCPPCRPEFETLNAIREEFAHDDVEVLAVNIFEDHFKKNLETRLASFLITTSPRFKVVGEGERVAELFGPVTRIPTTFVFGRDGRPALHFIHERGADKTHASLDELRAAVAAAL